MDGPIDILIADRNPHVREFLRRELAREGYRVRIARSGKELIQVVYHEEIIGLLILDPDLPDVEISLTMRKLKNRIPFLPVVIHTHASDWEENGYGLRHVVFVEKRGNSVERIKAVALEILRKKKPASVGGSGISKIEPPGA